MSFHFRLAGGHGIHVDMGDTLAPTLSGVIAALGMHLDIPGEALTLLLPSGGQPVSLESIQDGNTMVILHYDRLEQHLRHCALLGADQCIEHCSHIGLTRRNLPSLPAGISHMYNVTSAYFDSNNLHNFPRQLLGLRQMRLLDLTDNFLTGLPEDIEKLSSLVELVVAHNRLSSLPHKLGKLDQLQRLDLHMNPLQFLPHTIGGLRLLNTLDLYGNRLTSLPTASQHLSQLNWLTLRGNRLRSLPFCWEVLHNLG